MVDDERSLTADQARYFDLQVNGFGGIDFNGDSLSLEQLESACRCLNGHGVVGILATIITDHEDAMCERLARLCALREQSPLARSVITGLHIEGPFLSPRDGYRGAHPCDAITPASLEGARRLLDAGGGLVKVVTLAPEHDQRARVTRWLTEQGIVVSAGHCDPTVDQLDEAIDAGLSMFTHLGNGCPMQMHRHDNIVQRALSRSSQLWICFIADGVHVSVEALGNYLKVAGDRAVIVSDAMAAAGLGPGLHRLGRWEVEVGEELAAWAPNRAHLVGSAMSMKQMSSVLGERCGLDATRIEQLMVTNPRRVISIDE